MAKDAAVPLRAAIKLHEQHMNGTAPTSDKSQMEMMTLMKEALSLMTGKKNALGMSDEAMRDM